MHFLLCKALFDICTTPWTCSGSVVKTAEHNDPSAIRTRDLIVVFCTKFFSPTDRRRHITAGVEKQANTSSVQEKWVMCGRTTDCPRHWPHIYTWPLCVLAAEVWAEWQAAISTILEGRNHTSVIWWHYTFTTQILTLNKLDNVPFLVQKDRIMEGKGNS